MKKSEVRPKIVVKQGVILFDDDLKISEDFLMAYRFLYYCMNISMLTDVSYDKMEYDFLKQPGTENSPLRKVGSENKDDYSPEVRALGLYLAMRFCRRKNQRKISVIIKSQP